MGKNVLEDPSGFVWPRTPCLNRESGVELAFEGSYLLGNTSATFGGVKLAFRRIPSTLWMLKEGTTNDLDLVIFTLDLWLVCFLFVCVGEIFLHEAVVDCADTADDLSVGFADYSSIGKLNRTIGSEGWHLDEWALEFEGEILELRR